MILSQEINEKILFMPMWYCEDCKICNKACLFQMDNSVIVSDYAQMDRVLREERQYILDIIKKIKKAGCNVLLIQKSVLRYVL